MDRLTDDQMQQAVESYLRLAGSGTTVSACHRAKEEAKFINSKIADSPQEDKALEGELKDERDNKRRERRKMAWELILMAAKGRRIDMWMAIEAWKVVDKFNESEGI